MTIIRPSHSAMVHLGECVHSYETSGQAPRYTISASVITVEMTCASRQIPIEFDSTKVFPLPLIFNAFEKSFNRPRVCKQEPNSMMSLLTKEVPFVLTELWERVLEDVQSRIVIQLGLVILTSSKASAFDFFFLPGDDHSFFMEIRSGCAPSGRCLPTSSGLWKRHFLRYGWTATLEWRN